MAATSRTRARAPLVEPGMAKPVTKSERAQKQSTGDRILNRELSALTLNERVLDLASDPEQPLLERVRYCSIVSRVLDEFFMIRVAGLLDQAVSGLPVRSTDGRLPQEVLDEIRKRVLALTRAQSKLWTGELCPALADEGVVIGSVEDLSKRDLEKLERDEPDAPTRARHRALPALALSRHGDRGARVLPRYARRRLRGLGRGRRPPRGVADRVAQTAVRRRRPPRGVGVDIR